MDVRDKVVRAVETGTPRNKATSLSSVRTKRAYKQQAYKLSDDIRDKVLKAVERGMTCRQAAAHYGVSPTTALNWAKNANIPRTRTSTKRISDKVRDKVLKAVEGGMSCRQAAAHCGVSLASAIRWTKHFRT